MSFSSPLLPPKAESEALMLIKLFILYPVIYRKDTLKKIPVNHPPELSLLEKTVSELSKLTGFEKYQLELFL